MPESDPPVAKMARLRPRDPPAPNSASAFLDGEFCVVGIGASAGGLDACKRLLMSLPASPGMAFILVQHIDPTHESMLVALLSDFTAMPVLQATDGMLLEIDHFYVIPPGVYLSLGGGMLHLSEPTSRHGAGMPIDFLLHSLGVAAGAQAICVILSGSGTDGTIGLRAIKAAGGLVIAQDPEEAGYAGMPRSAIAGNNVDFILPVERIAQKLVSYGKPLNTPQSKVGLTQIIDLLRAKTLLDFASYKPGTLERRIARRMGLLEISPDETARYLDILESDKDERERLAEDLLINVTRFFRDPKIFETLASSVIPELVAAAPDRPIRIWIAGCSTGEETYSITMLFQEHLKAIKSSAALQVFASDIDAQAVAAAREGFYSASIDQKVSAERLAEFFIEEEHGYRVSADLRGKVVFAVHDVLSDPPFSKLDFISCRNLLIYLKPAAQKKVISVFNFALLEGGVLLLGSAETINAMDQRFSVISAPERLYCKAASGNSADMQFAGSEGALMRMRPTPAAMRPQAQPADIAEFCKRLVLATHSPAAILINEQFERLYSSGATERYLRVVQGYPTEDMQAMLSPALRLRVKAAVKQAGLENARVIMPGGRIISQGRAIRFNIDVLPVTDKNKKLFLICFIDQPNQDREAVVPEVASSQARLVELEQDLKESQAEIDALTQSLEQSNQERIAANEEALSISEEFQSTNEELMTSKEELQSLNEELTSLNTQLQETLDKSRTTSNDLQNILYSTDVATVFLDTNLKIRFFTPATRVIFSVITSDIGRPLSDLHSLATDTMLLDDARSVLKTHLPMEREVEAKNGRWFTRRILPYRTQTDVVAGIVITFTDITEQRQSGLAVTAAKLESERASTDKSRFLAAASHDLRQPLQTLALLNSLMAKIVAGEQARSLVNKMDEITNSMGGILDTLLDINQLDAGIIKPVRQSFCINILLQRLSDEFAPIAMSRGLDLRMVGCSQYIFTDPKILEQMMRNLLSNALKYTEKGVVLLGCRRSKNTLSIEIWDTGLGIPEHELGAIFDDYHQVDNAARERGRGLGLGLAIVRRLGELLGHRLAVVSSQGRGSGFSIKAEMVPPPERSSAFASEPAPSKQVPVKVALAGNILVVDDDPDIRLLLEMFLKSEGHSVAAAASGEGARKLVSSGAITPDLIIIDYNLPNGEDGLAVVRQLQENLPHKPSVILCTGDISAGTLKKITQDGFSRISKPMKLTEMNVIIQRALGEPRVAVARPAMAVRADVQAKTQKIFVIDDDEGIRTSMRSLFEANGQEVETFRDSEQFLNAPHRHENACLLVDANLPGMSGLELLRKLSASHSAIPAIVITGQGDVKMAVQAMKAGAFDFVEKPISAAELLACVGRAFQQSKDAGAIQAKHAEAAARIALLTVRQREIMDRILAGQANKNIASDLGISQRTVENHRAAIMDKTKTNSLPALARLAMMANGQGSPG